MSVYGDCSFAVRWQGKEVFGYRKGLIQKRLINAVTRNVEKPVVGCRSVYCGGNALDVVAVNGTRDVNDRDFCGVCDLSRSEIRGGIFYILLC